MGKIFVVMGKLFVTLVCQCAVALVLTGVYHDKEEYNTNKCSRYVYHKLFFVDKF